MKFGLLKYREEERNIGDYIQSIAAKRFLPQVNEYISRERLNRYSGKKLKMILNGWFMHEPKNWPPSNDIEPLFVAFHINESVSEFMTTEESINYYKKHEPIGCRDIYTRDLLLKNGVDAYFSGCVTLTLRKGDFLIDNKRYDVVVCDPFWTTYSLPELFGNRNLNLFQKLVRIPYCFYKQWKFKKLVNKLIPKSIKNRKYLTHYLSKNCEFEEKFEKAEEMLQYYANAKLVITGRIHVALPCLAFNTPVLFVNPERDTSRFNGITDLFNEISISELKGLSKEDLQKKYAFNEIKNPNKHIFIREEIINNCKKFVGK